MQDASTRWGEACGHCGGVGVGVLNPVNYSAYGTPDAAVGSPFAFTGEQRNSSGLQYHRARYYSPALGMWISEDPLETPNRYGYVGGNVVNAVDRSGMVYERPEKWGGCVDSISSKPRNETYFRIPSIDDIDRARRETYFNAMLWWVELNWGTFPDRNVYNPEN